MDGVNSKVNKDDFDIDIVAEALDGSVEAYEVKRNPQKYSPARLEEKVTEMKRRIFRGKEIQFLLCSYSSESAMSLFRCLHIKDESNSPWMICANPLSLRSYFALLFEILINEVHLFRINPTFTF